ncbi:START domain-containing protein [Mucilaginibacter sp.]|uniref:START domain-containing protein n=1 Tax=Mucilaginibacter sp. TaxID=1882438 RepID=UPI0035BC1E8F
MLSKISAVLLLLTISSATLHAQQSWTLKSDNDGIKLYTGPVQNSKVKALRVECTFQANLSQIVAVLLDVNNCTEWVYKTKSCTLLKQVSPSELYYYSEVSLPWPVQNRDFVAHLTVTQDADTKVVTVDGPAVKGMVPPKTDIVRISESKGKWLITPVNKNEIRVEYTLTVDPAGNIPAWIANLVSSEGPVQSFKALRLQLKKAEYRNAALSFIKN